MKRIFNAAATVAVLAAAAPAMASVIVGGYTFDNNAFADTLIASSGVYSTSGGALASVLTDTDPGTYAFSESPGAFVQLGFNDNTLVNGAGADLVLFELGVPSIFKMSITIGGMTMSYASVYTGFSAGGFALNAAAINLDDFGIAPGANLSNIVIGLDNGSNTLPSLSLVGALRSSPVNVPVPEPTSLALLGIAALAGGLAQRNRMSRIG